MPKSLANWFIALAALFILALVVGGAHAQPLRGGLVTAPPAPPAPIKAGLLLSVPARPVVLPAVVKPAPAAAKPAVAKLKPAAVPKLTYAQTVAADLKYSASLLYLRELTGNNDAPEIDAWARATGTARYSSWCGLFQWAVQKNRNGPVPNGPAGSYNWFVDKKRTFYLRGQRGTLDSLKPADKVGFYYVNLKRIGHILLVVEATRGVRKGRPARGYVLRSGNTGRGGGRNGAGVYDLFYTAPDIYAAARW